ncbi:MAG: carboxylesterase family protein, partial [Schwartzia sp.]|nr:carboxylesterase family protein [Schwartzia sp. (in: firmicutes)]
MKRVKLSRLWRKRLAASLLPLSVILAAPAGMLPQGGQICAEAAAAQEQAQDFERGGTMSEMSKEEMMQAINEAKAMLRAQYGENRRITDGSYNKSLAVKCVNGIFVGKKTENIIAYRGIPFVGKQPSGELRWKAPVDVTPDDGVYEAYFNAKSAYGNEQLETGSLFYLDEDCLYLNIWKADEPPAKKKPVMVWIHGGAFEAGGTVDPMFDCHNFVKENPDVIVVTIADRLGPFGFLHLSHLPDGADYPDAQNLGLMDQRMALKWVHENIASFGGAPDNVTIFGESAGAASCTLLPLLDGSQAYFKRVIAQSGSPNQTRSAEESIACTNELMEVLGCKTVGDLQKLDAQKIFEAFHAEAVHEEVHFVLVAALKERYILRRAVLVSRVGVHGKMPAVPFRELAKGERGGRLQNLLRIDFPQIANGLAAEDFHQLIRAADGFFRRPRLVRGAALGNDPLEIR